MKGRSGGSRCRKRREQAGGVSVPCPRQRCTELVERGYLIAEQDVRKGGRRCLRRFVYLLDNASIYIRAADCTELAARYRLSLLPVTSLVASEDHAGNVIIRCGGRVLSLICDRSYLDSPKLTLCLGMLFRRSSAFFIHCDILFVCSFVCAG